MQHPPNKMLHVWWSCHKCGLKDRHIVLRFRRVDEDILDFMNYVIAAIGRQHASTSPSCRTKKLNDLKIPLPDPPPENYGIGMYHPNLSEKCPGS